ncbi:MAG: type-F conjugative transfer system secretin TraK [Thauera sp.]|jgi:conjugal transfer pilus assembly protein TraK|nr:conjugal transfer pilus assembly protein TraK [Delftia acidovorans CCUG 274B]KZT16419.1 conjugal transfer pilus assembly protein TraK [Acidovorax sp. GW101-3H11]MBO0942390.1 type-F conjugative transfer system secretin TraK [Acidovorax temperans]MBP8216094.1 type-F conjugative transfer system secretin TraK [Thauera sp.]PZP65871.1 MAG: conjugal transfer pilus assembly protein TraK [Delftia acidovorans]
MRSSDIACTPPRLVGPAPTGPRPAPTRLAKLPPLHSAPSRQRWDSLSPAARRILAVTALSFGLQAHALQVVEASDGVAVEAIASLKEPTRIRIEGTPITDVFGNIYSSHCGGSPLPAAAASPGVPSTTPGPATPAALTSPAVNPAGDVIVECDRDKGEVYIRPVGDATRPINLFVSSASATYTLLLRRSDTPADTIVIRDKTPRALRPATPDAAPSGPAPSHVRTMKALLVAMASDRVPPDVRVEETSRSIQLWAEARFTLLRLYEGRGLTGEKYTLQNVGTAPMVLAEQEFDRPDSRAGGAVAGIAIEHHNLRPGETTSIYVIRRGGTR